MTARHLTPSPPPGAKFSRRCRCGCGQWAKWIGMEDGVALMVGCDLAARRWKREQPPCHRCLGRGTVPDYRNPNALNYGYNNPLTCPECQP